MQMDDFGKSADAALAFSTGLIAGLNLSGATLFMLAAKGLITKDEALWVIDGARDDALKMPMADVYAEGVANSYAQLRANIASGL